jgi:porin
MAQEVGQEPETAPPDASVEGANSGADDAEDPGQDRAGFGGPNSVGVTLQRDDEVEPTELASYFAFKDSVANSIGLSFGFDYFALYQGASSSPGEDGAASGVVRAFGTWKLVNRGSDDTGSLVFKVENRHLLGTEIAPQDLGFEIGYVGLTAVPFSDIGWALTNLYWEQMLAGGRFAFVAGILDPADYMDVYALVNPWADFSNLAFSTDPTIPLPNQGFGVAFRWSMGDHLYLLGGAEDANGDPTDPGNALSSFFGTGELYSHVEFGWTLSTDDRFTDNVHLMMWHVDDREEAGVPGGWGTAASWSQKFGTRWIPFVRAGWADGGGGIWDRSLSVGSGYSFRNDQDQFAVGLNWGRPPREVYGPEVSDQYTIDVFYRWRPMRILHVTPGVQFLVDPALNPDEDLIVVWGLRARLAF